MKKLYNFLENINIKLFLLINASENSDINIVKISIFFSKKIIILFPIILLFNFLLGKEELKKSTIFSIFSTNFSIILNFLLKKFLIHPRPFMIPIGRSLFYHISSNSIPSNHASISLSISISLIINKHSRLQGYILFILSLVMSFARIYDGIHFPIDIIVSFLVSIISVMVTKYLI